MASPIALTLAAYKRSGFPEAVTVNCLPESAPTLPSEPAALIARPGLETYKASIGDGPWRGLLFKEGLFSGDVLSLAQSTVRRMTPAGVVTDFTGSVSGDDLVDWDAGQDADLNPIARIATGDALYKVHDTFVTVEDFPEAGGAGASSVAYHRSYWLATEAGTDKVYFQVPGDTTWDALSFGSAEYDPDPIVAIRTLGDTIWLLGTTTLEGWTLTGNTTEPFITPMGGLSFPIGCRTRNAAINCRGALIFVDDACMVRMTEGGEPIIISDNGLSEQIRKVSATDLVGGFYLKDGHPIYSLRLGSTATWNYDLAAKKWWRANSDGYDFWRAQLFCTAGDTVYCTDAISTALYRLDPDRRTDGDETFTMEFMAILEALSRPVPIANLELHLEVGGSPRSGQGSDPLIWMQMSRDKGKTWGAKKYRGLGATGKYATRVRWNALGMADAPFGAMFRFGVSDPVVRRISGAWVNT